MASIHEQSRTAAPPAREQEAAVLAPRASAPRTDGGLPLDPQTRAVMERGYRHDFSAVRVHADDRAAGVASDLHADAFTIGNDIHFASRAYHPETPDGRGLIAHELAHVVQQRIGGATPSSDLDADRAAEGAATAVTTGGGLPALKGTRTGPAFQRSVATNDSSKAAVAPLSKATRNSPTHQQLMSLIEAAVWHRAAELLNKYNVGTMRSVFGELRPRQVESLYIGAIMNDRVGEESNIAIEALAASPELQDAVGVVLASGISMKEFVDYCKGNLRVSGIFREWAVRKAANSLSGEVLSHVLTEDNQTLYMFASGRQGTITQEQSRKLAEFQPHSVTGAASGLIARALTDDQEKIENAAALGDTIGAVGGAMGSAAGGRNYNRTLSEAGGNRASTSIERRNSDTRAAGGTDTGKVAGGDYRTVEVNPSVPPGAGLTRRTLPDVRIGLDPRVRAAGRRAMDERPAQGPGAAGEGAAFEISKQQRATFDLNDLRGRSGNFPTFDYVTAEAFVSVKTKSYGTVLTTATIRAYLNDVDTVRNTAGGPGYATTKTEKAAALVAANRATIQAHDAWPTKLAPEASEAEILAEMTRGGQVAVPDDHLGPLQDAIEAAARENPAHYSGESIPSLRARFRPMGITSEQLKEIYGGKH